MESRYNRPSSPRGRYTNPARSSTGTFADPYYDSSYYGRPSSPRSSADRIGGSHYPSSYYMPSSSTASRTSNLKYDAYTGRPRRSTNEHMSSRPNASSLTNTTLPLRTPYTSHSDLHRPSSPLAHSYDKRGDTYISQPARREHKKVYSVDDASRSTRLVAEKDTIESSRHRDSVDRGYSVTSGGRSYGSHNSKPPPRLTDFNDDAYSYTDPASMYRDTEPAWRRPRAGSLERGSRPSSMIVDRPARSSTRDLGPPPSIRGFDKINNSVARPYGTSHGRSSSIEASRETPKYEPYPDAAPKRTSSTRQRPTSIHQEPREQHRRDTYHDEYDRRDRDAENRRHTTADRYEDPHVSSRGFGIAPGPSSLAHDHHALDRQPLHSAADTSRARPQDSSNQYYQSDRADARMPEPRVSRDRDLAPPQDSYDKHPREGSASGYIPAAAGAAAGVAATLGAAGYIKSRDKDRESDRDSSAERERERRREYDERDRRDRHDDWRDDRRDRAPEPLPPRPQQPAIAAAPPPPPPSAAYPPPPETDRRPRERRYEDDDRDNKERSSRKAHSSEGSGDERPRHYVERDAESKKEPAASEAALDPDEEYRRRIQQEAERTNRATRGQDSDSDRERTRRRRKDRSRSRSRGGEDRSRYDERSSSVYDASLVQEPESLERALEPASKSVQIVAPPKEALPPPKGILRKPTEKFPEDPEPIREGVAPHKDALKGKDIPVGARWTRIDRRLVNPEALEQAKERFEERMDCVIVLRVLTKEEIQKLADRTRKIRETREDEFERRDRDERDREDRDDRDRRSHRSHKDDRDDRDYRDEEDRDRDRERRRRSRRYEDERDSDYDDLDRERERSKRLEIEPAR